VNLGKYDNVITVSNKLRTTNLTGRELVVGNERSLAMRRPVRTNAVIVTLLKN
jgi:hypothetical protein